MSHDLCFKTQNFSDLFKNGKILVTYKCHFLSCSSCIKQNTLESVLCSENNP